MRKLLKKHTDNNYMDQNEKWSENLFEKITVLNVKLVVYVLN